MKDYWGQFLGRMKLMEKSTQVIIRYIHVHVYINVPIHQVHTIPALMVIYTVYFWVAVNSMNSNFTMKLFWNVYNSTVRKAMLCLKHNNYYNFVYRMTILFISPFTGGFEPQLFESLLDMSCIFSCCLSDDRGDC